MIKYEEWKKTNTIYNTNNIYNIDKNNVDKPAYKYKIQR